MARAADLARVAKNTSGKKSDDEDDEDAVYKQRSKDDWKDDNPRGWGNSKLRPTA
jgi:immunoglobulin-binding protein 1